MIRVTYVVSQLGRGGQERQLLHLLGALDRSRVRPSVVAWRASPEDVYVEPIRALGIELRQLPGDGPVRNLLALRRAVRELRADVVHSYSYFTNFAVAFATAGTRAKALGGLRNDFLSERALAGPVLGRASARWPAVHVSNNGRALANAAADPSWFRPRDVRVVPNGADLASFASVVPRPDDPPLLLGIGSLTPPKRWHLLVELAARLHGPRLVVLGEGPERPRLEALARRLGAGDRVSFPGASDDVRPLLARAALLVHVSAHEGLSNVVMEAMAAGVPVVATDAGDMRSLVVDGETGRVVPVDDVEGVAEAVRALLSDPARRAAMGVAGRAVAIREFSLERLAARTCAVYDDVLGASPTGS
jgi:glycosyltransferase involved in cell wall biosynthesis